MEQLSLRATIEQLLDNLTVGEVEATLGPAAVVSLVARIDVAADGPLSTYYLELTRAQYDRLRGQGGGA